MSADMHEEDIEMNPRNFLATMTTIALAFLATAPSGSAQQDRYALKYGNGIAFSEFKGYETWQTVAPSQPDDGLKVITANSLMISAYKEGIPGNSKPVPVGAMMAKIEWS